MSTQADYGCDEWDLIIGSPALVALAVMHVGEHSHWMAHRQLLAVSKCIDAITEQGPTNALMQAVAAADRDGRSPFWPTELPADLEASQQWAVERCRQVATLLAQKSPEEEAEIFARWLLSIGQRVTLVEDDQEAQGQESAWHAERQRSDLDALAIALGVQARENTIHNLRSFQFDRS